MIYFLTGAVGLQQDAGCGGGRGEGCVVMCFCVCVYYKKQLWGFAVHMGSQLGKWASTVQLNTDLFQWITLIFLSLHKTSADPQDQSCVQSRHLQFFFKVGGVDKSSRQIELYLKRMFWCTYKRLLNVSSYSWNCPVNPVFECDPHDLQPFAWNSLIMKICRVWHAGQFQFSLVIIMHLLPSCG